MIEAAFDSKARKLERRLRAVHRAKHLGKRNVEVAQAGMRGLLLLILLLGLRRQPILQVPHVMRERAILRDQQQSRQQYLHQAAFQHHRNKLTQGVTACKNLRHEQYMAAIYSIAPPARRHLL